jgi:hypothetical protein
VPVTTGESGEERDEAAAEVLSIGYFTTLQILLATILYSPALLALAGVFSFVDVGTFFTTASLAEFIIGGFFLYLLSLTTPFAALLWAMTIKLIIGGAGCIYGSGSSDGLSAWCSARWVCSIAARH